MATQQLLFKEKKRKSTRRSQLLVYNLEVLKQRVANKICEILIELIIYFEMIYK